MSEYASFPSRCGKCRYMAFSNNSSYRFLTLLYSSPRLPVGPTSPKYSALLSVINTAVDFPGQRASNAESFADGKEMKQGNCASAAAASSVRKVGFVPGDVPKSDCQLAERLLVPATVGSILQMLYVGRLRSFALPSKPKNPYMWCDDPPCPFCSAARRDWGGPPIFATVTSSSNLRYVTSTPAAEITERFARTTPFPPAISTPTTRPFSSTTFATGARTKTAPPASRTVGTRARANESLPRTGEKPPSGM
mmetsp:Transcript_81872/g.250183  ORF Transcript_81872/g.250183 Transcript_81872/m.250183 type:complete len:251 (-) Transcript_81872:716-1468(-)